MCAAMQTPGAGDMQTQTGLGGLVTCQVHDALGGLYMIGNALIQIIKTNDPRNGVKDGRPWSMQDAECLLLNDDGTPATVGVLQLPKELMGDRAPKPGVYTGAFALRSGMRDRRIEAVLTSLQPAGDRIKVQPK
jgi:hypothetical protein